MIIGLDYIISNVLGYIMGISVSFYLNRMWTFDIRSNNWGRDLLRFIFVIFVSYLINLSLVIILVEIYSTHTYLAQIAGIFVYSTVSFVGMKKYVFVSTKG